MKKEIGVRFEYALPSEYFREEQNQGHDPVAWSHKVVLRLEKSIQRYSTTSFPMFEIYSEMETAALFDMTVEELRQECREGLFLMPFLDLDGEPQWLVWEVLLWQIADCPPAEEWNCGKAMEQHLGTFRNIIWQMYSRQLDVPSKDCS